MSSLSTSRKQISIFDIPHILDLICDDLSKEQLLTCLDVSRAWRESFTPQALRYVRFSNLRSHQTWTILRKARLIRSLTIDISDAGWFLDNPDAATCANLRELRCVDFNYQPKPKLGEHTLYYTRPSVVDQSNNALRLIEFCSKLETLVVDNLSCQYWTDHFTEAVLKSIYTCTALTKIKIHLEYAPRDFWTVLIKSLPAGLKDLEFSLNRWILDYDRFSPSSVLDQSYPKDGYPWQQQEQQDSAESSSFSGSQLLPLERLALGKLYPFLVPRWAIRSLDEGAEPTVAIDQVVPKPEAYTRFHPSFRCDVTTEMVKSANISWANLLRLLLDNCPDLETVDLYGSSSGTFCWTNGISTDDAIQFIGSFPALKEWRLSGYISEQLYEAIAVVLVRSAATLEVVRIYRDNNEQALGGANPIHIGTTASWTQCTRLRELGIHRTGGSKLTDHRWDIAKPFSVWEPTKDYSTVFGQLEKLQLAVREPLWNQCPDGSYVVSNYGGWYEEEEENVDDSDLDEQDDEDWKPLKAVNQTVEEKNLEPHKRLVERNHKRAFILQVRELFGRLKELEQLRELEIDWSVCFSISEMSLEEAFELFRETEVKDNRNDSEYERTSRGWWGEVTEEDLVWLCLRWAPRPNIVTYKIPSDIINVAARQYENKTQLLSGCHGILDCSSERTPWSTGDIYNTRVGRQWKDWDDIISGCHPYRESCSRCVTGLFSCGWFRFAPYDTYLRKNGSVNHVVQSRDFEVFVEGLAGSEESAWGRKMATRGDRGRYRQKAVGKMNQRK
ncbi:hypothetical protein BGZ96_010926 [Linnemannia gamsii]|uniref:F-box domain-containing protein n=1 Tax=Linnemannia gamsii TaxID=64522 RepID=A0ABQ7KBK6_9FUNG|nr:hypothetical protein BGZ96_010926 [Linnemannia gamsii]